MTTAANPKTPPKISTRRANALPSNHLLDEYRIDAILGAGGFGVTYKAFDTHLENWVAIKEYFPLEWSFRAADGVTVYANTQGLSNIAEGQLPDYEWGLERFLDEARVLARIQHPYVVRVKRYFRGHGTAYIVMDYEEGEPLSALLRDGETLGEGQIRGLLEDVLPALQAVHEQGYLHRDIKPSNLYVRSHDHRVILIDFGAARAAISRHSQSVSSLVTPGYSPPEQYSTRNDRYGPWTDIYALGAVLYRCVTGQTPVEAADRLMDDTLKPALAVGAGRYSTNLLRVIDRALAVRPEQRFRDVIEMQAGLSGLQDEASDETVIMTPMSKPKLPDQELAALRSALEDTGRVKLETTSSPPARQLFDDSWPPSQPPPQSLKNANAPRRWLWSMVFGGAGLAALTASAIWLWPSKPVDEGKSPIPSSSHQDEQRIKVPATTPPVSTTVETPTETPTETPLPSTENATPTPHTTATEQSPPAVISVPTPPPASESGIALPASAPAAATEPVQPSSVMAEPATPPTTATIPVSRPEPETPASTNLVTPTEKAEQTVPPAAPDVPPPSVESGSVGGVPLTPAVIPTVKPRSSLAPERVTAPQNNGKKKSSERNSAQAQPRTARQKARRDRTQPQPVIAVPAAPTRRAAPARADPVRNNPWDSPTSTGFNEK